MPRKKPLHLRSERTRHGKLVWYVRVGHEPRIRIREEYNTDAFWAAYRHAVEGAPKPQPAGPAPNTMAWLIDKYVNSGEWRLLKAATRRNRHSVYRQVEQAVGGQPLKAFTRKSIMASREKRADRPYAANEFVNALRALFKWGVAHGHAPIDPTDGIKPLTGKNAQTGFHTWTEAEVAQFQAKHPLGTRERVAFDVLLYTGLRRGDAVQLGRQHLITHGNGQDFSIRTEKTGMTVTAPILPILAHTLARGPVGDLTFITKLDGTPYDKQSFAFWFGKACKAAGVPGRAHGLRKAGAARAAEEGATESQLNALFGWADGSRESAVYTRTANRAKMAREARRNSA
ncbi:tyrosine-type recombinase/integrase [Methylobacterium sp. 092160098-2]|uniref:tyrosine-type recombinase/integrase n=1 Tax=Methylobacterium sp. 092160098-2 TaxID=3025129 RepID=UPI002381AFF9|nr:tyrosine-type recombinase/integrase [Methylobacterium sp. 092160098-2]MDE4913513.1 tyrosine-type recombinase/integrase [Methylobacterium sp. 092160098-2]